MTITAATTTTSVAVYATTGFVGNVAADFASIDVAVVHFFDGINSIPGILEGHETEAFRATSIAISWNVDIADAPIMAELFF